MSSSLPPFRDINLLVSPSHYAFRSASSSSAPTLIVDRPTGDLRLDYASAPGSGARRVSSIAGILGILTLKLGAHKYIIVISKSKPVGRLCGHTVYKVQATEFLPLRDRPLQDHDEIEYLAMLRQFIASSPMYFSYSLDITNSFQRQSASNVSLPLWQRADDRFFWNKYLQSDLIAFRQGTASKRAEVPDVDPYILPVIFGMMDITQTKVKNTPFTFALITRRSRHRAGTRYFSRGIDEHGHVSNYNETEQIIVINDNSAQMTGFGGSAPTAGEEKRGDKELQVLAYVQTRGSVPVYWSEINNLKYTPKLQVRPIVSALSAARAHFQEQIDLYGENYLVNLVNQGGRERVVKEAYEAMVHALISSPDIDRTSPDPSAQTSEKTRIIESANIKENNMNRLHYVYFDFHNETKGLKWHRAELLLKNLQAGLTAGQYFYGVEKPYDQSAPFDVRCTQKAVVRTNCMDCLDRTNVVQSMLGRWALNRQLTDLGILAAGESAFDNADLTALFRNVWADNADAVSKTYSGTGALKTDFTRTGERTRAGMLQDGRNSIRRYFKNNFLDGSRQDAFDVFHGAYVPSDHYAGREYQLVDHRPLAIQSVPYLLGASAFLVLLSIISGSPGWCMRLFTLFWLGVAGWSGRFILKHGMLYVRWPRLNTPTAAVEGYLEALNRAAQDDIIGQLLPGNVRHVRTFSNAKVGFMEEGKKRVE
ncbi:hypothetical protein KEM54_000529 [Ascosphaera aggregata]|nr:hypothetical protein KEM54_000529 [Ascosphaera aggregata]